MAPKLPDLLGQYPIICAITSNLTTQDLLYVALACKDLYACVTGPTENYRNNIRNLTLCKAHPPHIDPLELWGMTFDLSLVNRRSCNVSSTAFCYNCNRKMCTVSIPLVTSEASQAHSSIELSLEALASQRHLYDQQPADPP